MKRKIVFFGILTTVILIMSSCSNKQEHKKEIITKKIMYDVSIVNEDLKTEEDFKKDWFWLNVPETDLDKLLTTLFDDVKEGKVKSFKYDNTSDYEKFEEILQADLKKNFETEWAMSRYTTIESDSSGNVVLPMPISLDKKYIKQLRFLEEWYFEGDEFCKRVIAVAPVYVYEVPGESKGINIFYWVYIKDLK